MGYAATLTIVLFVVVNIFAVMFFYATSGRKRRG
jgi:hypothetical protein